MKRKHVICFASLVFLIVAKQSFALSYQAYEEWGGIYYDANKTWNGDGQLCWAAAASNALAYTGWGFPSGQGFQNEQDIFSSFVNHWPDYGSNPLEAYTWWFNTRASDRWPKNDVPGGGHFYPDVDLSTIFHRTLGAGSMSAMDEYLHQGYGVTTSIRTTSGSNSFHALSVYGYEYDENGNYLGFYYVENQDGVQTNFSRYLRYEPVSLRRVWDGSLQWVFGEMQDGQYLEGSRYISDVTGLDRLPSNPVPEPATMILFGTGLAGLAATRRRKKAC